MIETNEEGQRQIDELMLKMNDPVFNTWEKNFIRDMRDKKYEFMSKNQKAVITRLYDWLTGKP